MTCIVVDCVGTIVSKGMCRRHYNQSYWAKTHGVECVLVVSGVAPPIAHKKQTVRRGRDIERYPYPELKIEQFMSSDYDPSGCA